MDIMDSILQAAKERKVLYIDYVDSKGQRAPRFVEPYELKPSKSGDLTLWAHCQGKDQMRQFKVANITLAEIKEDTYEPRWDIKIAVNEETTSG